MSWPGALTSVQYDRLRGTASAAPSYSGVCYISACPNTIVYKGTLTTAPSGASYAAVTVSAAISGSLANVRVGQTVLIAPADDQTKAVFTGRVRRAPVGSTLYINETSASVASGYYVWVIDDYRIWDKLPRKSGSVYYVDYDQTFRELLPVFSGLNSAYAAEAVSGSAEFSFAPDAVAATSGASISGWLWNVADGTITVGSTTTKDITVTFPPGFRWIHVTATDSGGRSNTFHIPVWVHSSSYPPQIVTADGIRISGDVSAGWSMQMTAYDDLAGRLDNTLVCLWSSDRYNNTAAVINTNVMFVGRLRQIEDVTRADADAGGRDKVARVEVEHLYANAARVQMTSYEIRDKASPAVFGDIRSATIWRGLAFLATELTTLSTVCSISFPETGADFRFAGSTIPAGNIVSAMNDLADAYNASLVMSAAGRIEFQRDARLLTTSERAALVTVASLDTRDVIEFSRTRQHVRTVGRVTATGGTYNTSTRKARAVYSIAPGVAQDYPDGSFSLTRQVVEANLSKASAQSALNVRTGHALARAQQADTLNVTFPDGYWFLQPALNRWYTFDLPADETVTARAVSPGTRWLLLSVDVDINGVTGERAVTARYTAETAGAPGQSFEPPALTSAPPVNLPPITVPPFQAFPPVLPPPPPDYPVVGDTGAPTAQPVRDGNYVIAWTDARLFATDEFLKSSAPVWYDVTPPSSAGTVQAAAFGFDTEVYCVTSAGTAESLVHYISDVFNPSAAWSASAELTGVYETLRTFTVKGDAQAISRDAPDYFPNPTGATVDFENYADPWPGWTAAPVNTSGVGNPGACIDGGQYQIAGKRIEVTVYYTGVITSLTADIYVDNAVGAHSTYFKIDFSPPQGQIDYSSGPVGTWYSKNWNVGSVTAVSGIKVGILYDNTMSGGNNILRLDNIKINGGAPVGVTGVTTAYTEDYASSFTLESVSTSAPPAWVGFDLARPGTLALASGGTLVYKSAAGGAWTPYSTVSPGTRPIGMIHYPHLRFGSTLANASANPEFLAGAVSLGSGTQGLWTVTGSGSLWTNITPYDGVNYGYPVSPNAATMFWTSGDIIAGLFDFDGTRRFGRTLNTGGSWLLHTTGVSAAADHVRTRRTDLARRQVFFANGTNVAYIPNVQAGTLTLENKTGPDGNTVKGVEVYG